MSEQPDLSTIMQQVGHRGFPARPSAFDLTAAMQQYGHRGRTQPVASTPAAPQDALK